MNFKNVKDQDLLKQTKALVENERKLLTHILYHLQEVDRRKLFSDLGYQSLFDYAVKELRYSEGQAGRRIQAMRLLREIPELECKIRDGKLSLSNLSQAQGGANVPDRLNERNGRAECRSASGKEVRKEENPCERTINSDVGEAAQRLFTAGLPGCSAPRLGQSRREVRKLRHKEKP